VWLKFSPFLTSNKIEHFETGSEDKIIMADHLHDSAFSYRKFSYEQGRTEDVDEIRAAAKQGKAWGKAASLERLATELNRVVAPRNRGRPKKENK